jgi:serine/threonine protein kinase
LEKTGSGAYSTVYRAKDTRLNTFVAVKLLRVELTSQPNMLADLGKLFSREAQTQASLTHPNIARVLDANVTEKGEPYIVTEFLEGQLLSHILGSKRPLPMEQVTGILKQLCSAVQYAHDERVIHRDLKPGNVMLVEQHGQLVLKVLDFGLATLLDQTHLTLSHNRTIGTPAYMSPEEWRGGRSTPQSDIYAIGIILYDMVTGRLPFVAQERAQLKQLHCETKPPDPCTYNSQLPRSAADVILKAIAKSASQRPDSAWDLLVSFEAAIADSNQRRASRARPPRKSAALKWALTAAVAVGLVALVPVGNMVLNAVRERTHKEKGQGGGKQPIDVTPSELAKAADSIDRNPNEWRSALQLVKEKTATGLSSDEQALAGTLRRKAIRIGADECERLRASASSRDLENANKQFDQAYACAHELVSFDDGSNNFESARLLPETVLQNWLEYGVAFVRKKDGDSAKKVGDRIRTVNAAAAAGLIKDAEQLIAEPTNVPVKPPATERLATARAKAMSGEWGGAGEILDGLGAERLAKDDRTLLRALQLLRKVHETSDKPAVVLDSIASFDATGLPPDSWEYKEIDSKGTESSEELLTNAGLSITDSLKAVKYRPKNFPRWAQIYLGRPSSEQDFEELLPALRDVPPDARDGWGWAVLTECLLRRPELIVTEKDEKEAEEAAMNQAVAAETGRFGHFVRGLVYRSLRNLPDARTEFTQAFDVIDTAQEPWQNDSRRALAATVHFESGRNAERGTNPNWVQAFADYNQCVQLLANPDSKYRVAFARAAFQVKKYEVAESATDLLLVERTADKLGAELYDVMIQNAQSRTANNKLPAAIDRFGQIIDGRSKGRFSNIDPVRFYKEVLVPATKVAEQAVKTSNDRRLAARIAAVHAAKARVLYDNRYLDWRFALKDKDPLREAADAWQAAIACYPDSDRIKAEYYTRHGFALKELPPVKIKDVQADAKGAKEADPDYPGGYALEAYLLSEIGQREYLPRDSGASIAKFEESIKAFQVAIDSAQTELARDPSTIRLLTDYHTNRSNANVWLANAVKLASESRMKEALEGAEADARLAIKLDETNAEAWGTLGNALEDISWAQIGGQRNRYPEAIEAFQKQIANSDMSPRGHTNLGRCHIKWFQDSNGTETKLAEAYGPLEKAIQLAPDYAEAHYWMGKVLLTQDNSETGKQRAYEQFALAIAQPQGGGRTWVLPIHTDIGGNPAAWRAIFSLAIPDKPTPAHAAAIAIRTEVIMSNAQELKAELTSPSTRLIVDIIAAANSATDDTTKAYAHRFAAKVLAAASKENPAKAATYRQPVIDHFTRSLAADPDIQGSWDSAEQLAILLQSLNLLKDAESKLQFALDRCPEKQRQRISDRLEMVRRKLRQEPQ